METHKQRCVVCGRVLGLTLNANSGYAAYCPDRPCILYPPVSYSRAEDPTRAPLILAVMECTRTPASRVNTALGKSGSYTASICAQQRKRWERAA
ncbi:hypothetical protein ACFYP4_02550 [Streptomyces sp. NPDC005551]|uniref:hypothetical protein n=1 Tax=Streptomyces sp. NPDC005551 TaxID=3364725 RepID=UPI0036A78653